MSTKKWAVVVAGLVAAAVAGASTLVSAATVERVARLTGEAEAPGPGDDDGRGRATIRVNKDKRKVCFNLSWRDIAAPTAAHIHQGNAGEPGDVVVSLFSAESPLPDTISGVRGCIDNVPNPVLTGLIDAPQSYYVNVHNPDFTAGAIRGQLREPRRR